MRIKKITLDNIRCFEHLEIDLTSNVNLKNWTIILGDNGVGKTTILRSIAIGLCEQTGASGLLEEMEGEWIRRGKNSASIKIDIEPYPEYNDEAYIITSFKKAENIDEIEVEQKISPVNPNDFSWNDLFVCGYGATRRPYGAKSYSEYTVTDSVYSIISDVLLQNPELSVRRMTSTGVVSEREIFSRVEKVLMLDEEAITMDKNGIKISGFWGEKMPLGALGDGFQATVAWLLDLYGWEVLFKDTIDDSEIKGIVLIDEIEQHLHPKWKKRIIGLLSEQFNNLQFIATTHSPLVVIGTTDLKDENCSIVALYLDGNKVKSTMTLPPRGKRVDQVLTSYLFDLLSTSDDGTKEEIQRYSKLYSKKSMTPQDRQKLSTLHEKLKSKLGTGESDLETKITAALDKILQDLSDEKLKAIEGMKTPDQYELLRQLKNLQK